MSKLQQAVLIVVLAMLSYLLIAWHQHAQAEEPLPETSQTTEPCFVTFGEKRFDGHCEFRKDENGVRYLGLFGEDGQLDIIMRITGDNKGQAYYLSPRVMKRMREVSA